MRTSRRNTQSISATRPFVHGQAVLATLVFLAFTGAVLATYTLPLEGSGLSTPSLGGLPAITVVGLLLAVAALGGIRLQRAHRSCVRTRKALSWIEGLHGCAPPATVAQATQQLTAVTSIDVVDGDGTT